MNTHMKDYMKHMLCEGLYHLMNKKSFEKITIKQICDEVGVIRGTFYNHFVDKYEALEYLTKELLFYEFNPEDDDHALYKHMIMVIDEHRDFFKRAFLIQGQNSFEKMLQNIFMQIFLQVIRTSAFDFNDFPCDIDFLASFYADSFKFIVKDWVSHDCQVSCEIINQRVNLLINSSFINLKNMTKNDIEEVKR